MWEDNDGEEEAISGIIIEGHSASLRSCDRDKSRRRVSICPLPPFLPRRRELLRCCSPLPLRSLGHHRRRQRRRRPDKKKGGKEHFYSSSSEKVRKEEVAAWPLLFLCDSWQRFSHRSSRPHSPPSVGSWCCLPSPPSRVTVSQAPPLVFSRVCCSRQ